MKFSIPESIKANLAELVREQGISYKQKEFAGRNLLDITCSLGPGYYLDIDSGDIWVSDDLHDHGTALVNDEREQLAAIVDASRVFAVLSQLIPTRPDIAKDCENCSGSGSIFAAKLICGSCGGIGWLV